MNIERVLYHCSCFCACPCSYPCTPSLLCVFKYINNSNCPVVHVSHHSKTLVTVNIASGTVTRHHTFGSLLSFDGDSSCSHNSDDDGKYRVCSASLLDVCSKKERIALAVR